MKMLNVGLRLDMKLPCFLLLWVDAMMGEEWFNKWAVYLDRVSKNPTSFRGGMKANVYI